MLLSTSHHMTTHDYATTLLKHNDKHNFSMTFIKHMRAGVLLQINFIKLTASLFVFVVVVVVLFPFVQFVLWTLECERGHTSLYRHCEAH